MTRHIFRRIIQSIPTIFGVTILSYLIMTAAPGGPAALLTFGNIDDENNIQRQQIEERYGLNDPWIMQYVTWVAGNDWQVWKNRTIINEDGEEELVFRHTTQGVIRGDFGESFRQRRPALDIILERVPATLELGIASLLVALLVGIPIGIVAAIWHGGIFDNTSRILAVVGNAIPNFWFGLMLILFVGVFLDQPWARGNRCDLSANSRTGCGSVPIYQRMEYLLLPTFVLAYGGIANFSRFMRTSMLDTVSSDFIRTAYAKGLRNRTVWWRHAARNSLIPIATFLGPAIVGVIGGSAITEAIFTWPGLGRVFVESISSRDYPVVMASVLIASLLTVVGYIISDILYAVFDPRIRF
ncbi:MAG: ABC transporter permease [Anaerolineae bacterium]|nr:ABC transporter permease [Anaerolineae bacterium]MDQ7034303.1 ABC transporter permease [Anaerolineae bacterium]